MRGRGIGSNLIRSLQQAAGAQRLPITLSTPMFGARGRAVYERLDFVITAVHPPHYDMAWYPAGPSGGDPGLPGPEALAVPLGGIGSWPLRGRGVNLGGRRRRRSRPPGRRSEWGSASPLGAPAPCAWMSGAGMTAGSCPSERMPFEARAEAIRARGAATAKCHAETDRATFLETLRLRLAVSFLALEAFRRLREV